MNNKLFFLTYLYFREKKTVLKISNWMLYSNWKSYYFPSFFLSLPLFFFITPFNCPHTAFLKKYKIAYFPPIH